MVNIKWCNSCMNLLSFLKQGSSDRESLARSCGVSTGHLNNVAYGLRVCSPALAVLLEKKTAGVVTRKEMRPDDWHLIWPELAEKEGADA